MTKKQVKMISERYNDCKELSRMFKEDNNSFMEDSYWGEATGIEETMKMLGYIWNYEIERFVKVV